MIIIVFHFAIHSYCQRGGLEANIPIIYVQQRPLARNIYKLIDDKFLKVLEDSCCTCIANSLFILDLKIISMSSFTFQCVSLGFGPSVL